MSDELEQIARKHAKTLVSKSKNAPTFLTMTEAIAALRELQQAERAKAAKINADERPTTGEGKPHSASCACQG